MRVILYTGKGGVGKTSVSAATSLIAAKQGIKTIVLSTDPAHSLADSFGVTIGGEPVEIQKNLHALEIDVNLEIKNNWEIIRKYLVDVLHSQGLDEVTAEEMLMFPGMEDLFSLLKIREFYDEQKYDLAIIDCAPTGNTARMLAMPEAIRWYMDKYFNIEKRIITAIKPFAEKVTKVPMPDKSVFSSVEDLYRKIDSLREILLDRDITSIRIIANPEKMVLQESQRALSYFHLFGMQVDLLIINKIFPKELKDSYFSGWIKKQDEYLKLAKDIFSPLPIIKVPYYNEEVIEVDALNKLGDTLFENKDPAAIFYRDEPFIIEKKDDFVVMKLKLPNIDKSELSLEKKGDEILLKINNFQRNFALPRSLAIRELIKAKYENDFLKLFFQ